MMVQDVALPPDPVFQPQPARQARSEGSDVFTVWLPAVALLILLVLRVAFAITYRVDSDEPQHLHVVWGWSHGLLQYRDLFDNHSPLFQMLCAPYFRLWGEHGWIIVPMRMAMLPLFLADLWIVYQIGCALFSRTTALWAAIMAGFLPEFFLVTTEFRTDDLWVTCWLLLVWVAVTRPLRGRWAFCFGLTLGVCFAVSMKTTLMLLSVISAAVGLLVVTRLTKRKSGLAPSWAGLLLALLGTLVVPGILMAFFASKHALYGADPRDMYYCVIKHNTLPGLGKWNKSGLHQYRYPFAMPLLMAMGWVCLRFAPSVRVGAGRALVLMICGSYYMLLVSYWPLVTDQDFIPVLPLAVGLAIPLIFFGLKFWRERSPALGGLVSEQTLLGAVSVLFIAAEITGSCLEQSPLDNQMMIFARNTDIVLHLTNPGDLVMDGKGETIFRNRPIYWVLEGVTIVRIQKGLILDDIVERMKATNTCIALAHRMRPADKVWLKNNFVTGEGKVWVAGQNLGPVRPAMAFHNEIAANYSFITEGGLLKGMLDGKPLAKTQLVPAGEHKLELTSTGGSASFLWSQAYARGFSPFVKTVMTDPNDS